MMHLQLLLMKRLSKTESGIFISYVMSLLSRDLLFSEMSHLTTKPTK